MLDREAGCRLTLLSAPAGFGKSTLLGEWLAHEERPVAWVSLDEGDNDPARFLSYLVAALNTVEEGIGEGVLAALRSPEPPRIEALAGALINEMAVLPGELDLIFDDYHLIDSESVHRIVSFLLEHLPEGAHLILSSRIDPPLPLPRLRARHQVAEIGSAELAFTPEETAAFLRGVMGLDLSTEDVATLEERTEGWIAGLQLAALSMRDRKDISGFIEAFSGSHRDVLDFLAEEVLDRQPGGVREFLLKTSIIDGLSGPLCDALTGRDDGQRTLEYLERENLFVVALDDERRTYRYHHLFADFLRDRLGREGPGRAAGLHRRQRHGTRGTDGYPRRWGTRWPPGTTSGPPGWSNTTLRLSSCAARARRWTGGWRYCLTGWSVPDHGCPWLGRCGRSSAAAWTRSNRCSPTPSVRSPPLTYRTSHRSRRRPAGWLTFPGRSRGCGPSSPVSAATPNGRSRSPSGPLLTRARVTGHCATFPAGI
jgi:hypothetical protein